MYISVYFRRCALRAALQFFCAWAVAQETPRFDISWPYDGAIFQRSSSNNGNITILGTFNSKRYENGGYTITATLWPLDVRTGNFTGGTPYTISVQQTFTKGLLKARFTDIPKGWYDLEVRAMPNVSSDPSFVQVSKVGIGDVYLIAGQSNAQGLPNRVRTDGIVSKKVASNSWQILTYG